MKSLLIFLLICQATFAVAQNDTTLLLPAERLSESDVLARQVDDAPTQVFAATRTLESLPELPFTVYIVTAEEILANGYVTLADVLRNLPGVRVSQPGSAIEGELFQLRGLSGNQYVKILINDVPVKTTAALGTPIGAQLPVRQAARIEVLYGAAAALFGNEAGVAVINIILKDSERPIFTQADLSFGNNRYTSIDLLFGGRLGKDKSIFRFSLFGSSTVRERTDVYWTDTLFQPRRYVPFGLGDGVYRPRMNFRPDPLDSNRVFQAPVAHESRLFGLTLDWRGLNFTYLRMGRTDHSALGRNPLATSWHNSTDRLDERQEMYALDFRIGGLTNSLSVLRYEVDRNSASHPVFDRLNSAVYLARQAVDSRPRQQLLDDVYARYAANDRFATAEGVDARFESRFQTALSSRVTVDAGLQLTLSSAMPVVERFTRPPELALFSGSPEPGVPPLPTDSSGLTPQSIEVFEALPFVQLDWHVRRFRLIAGASLSAQLNTPSPILTPSPRLGLLYHLDSSWTAVANFGTGFRRAPAYAQVNTFRINRYTGDVAFNAGDFSRTETTESYEAGLRYRSPYTDYQLLGFYQQADGTYRDGYFQLENDTFMRYGWQAAPGRALALWGVQATAHVRTPNFELTFGRYTLPVFELRGAVQYARGREWFGGDFVPTSDVRNQPRWIAQFSYILRNDDFQLILTSNRQTSALSKSVVYRALYQLPTRYDRMAKYRSWDLMARAYLSNHFIVYVQVNNLFNRRYAGLDASGTVDDLLFNPQQRRVIRLGINYNMDKRVERKKVKGKK